MKTLEIRCNNQTFILHPSGIAYWVEKHMLLIADVHLGKVTHFRKHGSAVPQASVFHNFEKLQNVVTFFKPKTICFLGDLFHSHVNNEWILFKNWIYHLDAKVVLVSGNHDIIAKELYDKINVKVIEEWVIDNFLLTHHPETRADLFNFAGHIHPSVRLKGVGKQFLKVSCFFRTENQMIFPAFGNFTGNFIMEPNRDDQIYVNIAEEVIQIKAVQGI